MLKRGRVKHTDTTKYIQKRLHRPTAKSSLVWIRNLDKSKGQKEKGRSTNKYC
jgi:hypothetical protein